MAQLFHPASNVIARVTIFGVLALITGTGLLAWEIEKSPYITKQGEPRPQPVAFSHEHHVRGLGVDCRYCHTSVEDSAFAGMPATKVCMSCHSQIWTNAPALEPVRASWRENKPIVWTRVHNLPGFVFFNHAIHVNKGVGCVTCHGEVDRMPLMWKEASLQMRWCLECHRDPVKSLRPREEVFNLHYQPSEDATRSGLPQQQLGKALVEEYHVRPRASLENCSTCHR